MWKVKQRQKWMNIKNNVIILTIFQEWYRKSRPSEQKSKYNTIQLNNSPSHVTDPMRESVQISPPLSCPHRSQDQLTSTPAGSEPICNRLAFPSTTTEPLQPQIVPSLPLELRDCLSTRLDPTSLYIKIYATRFFLLPALDRNRERDSLCCE